MLDTALAAQPLAGQDAGPAYSGSTPTPHGACLGARPSPDGDGPSHIGGPHEDAEQDLLAEVIQLRRAMQTRPTIDQALGILMATFSMGPEAAWSVLVMTSQNTNTKVHHLANDLVGTVDGAPLSKVVQEQLATAVAKTHATPAAPAPTL